MAEWHVPGMAIGVIQGDSVLLLEGIGYRDVSGRLPVTPRTEFGIASISKTFTAATIGILCDEGKLGWNSPIIDYVPDFRLYDEYATFHATPRDLLSHRTGISSFSDLMVYVWPRERDEIYKRLRYLEPSASFRQSFQYSNVSFVAAGAIVEELSGGTWEDFVVNRIFTPLEMDHSSFGLQIQDVDDFSYPYEYRDGRYARLPFRDRPAGGPSGGINSSAEDMVKWLRLYLDDGRLDERQVISSTAAYVIENPHVLTYYTRERHWSPLVFAALGWDFQPYLGHQMLAKGGIIDGFSGYVSFMPSEKIGVVILANTRSAYDLTRYLSYYIYDRLLNLDEFAWDEIIAADRPEDGGAPVESGEPQTRPETVPSLPVGFAGTYRHRAYGTAVVTAENGELRVTFNGHVTVPLEYRFSNTFAGEFSGAPIKVEFSLDLRGNVTSLESCSRESPADTPLTPRLWAVWR